MTSAATPAPSSARRNAAAMRRSSSTIKIRTARSLTVPDYTMEWQTTTATAPCRMVVITVSWCDDRGIAMAALHRR
jgi:hypothetical protein